MRKNRIKIQRINHIFISHLHGDHFFGLVGLISTMHLLGRNKELHIYAPAPLEEILNIQLKASQTELVYPLFFHSIDPDVEDIIYEDDRLTITTIPLDHRIPTCGFLFREKLGKRKLKKEVISSLNIPVKEFADLKNGKDFIDEKGTIIKNDILTDNPYPIRSYAYCSDTGYFEPIIPIVKEVNVLYHETTFTQDKVEVAREIAKFLKSIPKFSERNTIIDDAYVIETITSCSGKKLSARVNKFILWKADQLKSLNAKPVSNERIHKNRTILKQLYYLFDILSQITEESEILNMTSDRMREIEQKIGNWHDLINSTYFLNNFSKTKNRIKIPAFKKLKHQILKDRNLQRKEIVKILKKEVCI